MLAVDLAILSVLSIKTSIDVLTLSTSLEQRHSSVISAYNGPCRQYEASLDIDLPKQIIVFFCLPHICHFFPVICRNQILYNPDTSNLEVMTSDFRNKYNTGGKQFTTLYHSI